MNLIRCAGLTDDECKLYAIAALRGLSITAEIRDDIVSSGGLDALLHLTHHDDAALQKEVLACLCNLSLSGYVGAQAERFVASTPIASMVNFLCSADATYRLFGALTLGNVASKEDAGEEIMGMGALASLVSVANASDAETQRCIAYSLCNLAATDHHRRAIVTEGGLVPIVALACSEDEGDQLAAHSTLRALASDALNRVAIVREGALEALYESGSRSSDVNVLIEVA